MNNIRPVSQRNPTGTVYFLQTDLVIGNNSFCLKIFCYAIEVLLPLVADDT